jgi:excisionase family DNA binding protein
MIELSPKQLSELADALASRLAEHIAKQSSLLDYHGLAEWLSVSVPHIERLKRTGKIPFVPLGRRVAFDRRAVLDALTEPTKKARATDDDASLKSNHDSIPISVDESDTTLVSSRKSEVVLHEP